jgi:Tol biopolymer transport system component
MLQLARQVHAPKGIEIGMPYTHDCRRKPGTIGWLLGTICAALLGLLVLIGAGCKESTPQSTIRRLVWLAAADKIVAEVVIKAEEARKDSSLWLLDLQYHTAREIAIADGMAFNVSSAHDGNRFVFEYRPRPSGGSLTEDDMINPKAGVDIAIYEGEKAYRRLHLPRQNRLPVYSPAGDKIAFLHLLPDLPYPAGTTDISEWRAKRGIWVVDSLTGFARKVSHPGDSDVELDVDMPPQWSPDGRLLAFVRIHLSGDPGKRSPVNDLWVVQSDGGSEKRITSIGDVSLLPLVWSPDGRSIFFIREVRTGDAPGSPRMRSLWSVKVSGGEPQELLSSERLFRPKNRAYVAISPDGTRVAVISQTAASSDQGLWIINAVSRSAQRVARGEDIGNLAWSSDGHRIAFTRHGREVWIANADEPKSPQLVWRTP